MVAVRNKKTGKVIGHQPPYTKEGEFRLYTAMSGGKEPTGIGIFISPQTREHFRAEQRRWLAEHYWPLKRRADG